jgi:hypothetical protein
MKKTVIVLVALVAAVTLASCRQDKIPVNDNVAFSAMKTVEKKHALANAKCSFKSERATGDYVEVLYSCVRGSDKNISIRAHFYAAKQRGFTIQVSGQKIPDHHVSVNVSAWRGSTRDIGETCWYNRVSPTSFSFIRCERL